ncbi:MAG: DUF4855 domain-containing protein [Paludibacter sp.]|jgi:hypothetical protein|nr:DUF4855 domain-containing protein [Paludibacter sp.]
MPFRSLLLLISVFLTIQYVTGQYTGSAYEVPADTIYSWESERKTLPDSRDMVLLYGGGSHRSYVWDDARIKPYVTYVDESGNERWMFDGYLLLEIKDGNTVSFATGYTSTPASQSDWKRLVDYFFQKNYALGALNKVVDAATKRIGRPGSKRKIVIGMPEPIKTQTQWGSVKDGVVLNFANNQDRIDASIWYIDYVRKKFSEAGYDQLELAGFYWIAEEASNSRTITAPLADYLNKLNYSFNWIPYFNSPGWSEWKNLKFNYAWLQPNYFFKEPLITDRLELACQIAVDHNMDMEMEFDERILTSRLSWHYRLANYMEAFIRHGIWENKRITYYQGSKALYELSVSTDSADQAIYHTFCKFVADRSSPLTVTANWSFCNANQPSDAPALPGTVVPLFSTSSSSTRNFAFGTMKGNDRIFVFTRAGDGKARVLSYDAATGTYNDTLPVGNRIAATNAGNLVSIGDGGLTDDGVLLLANVVGPKAGSDLYQFKVYKWENENELPEVVVDYHTGSRYPTGRFGDKIEVAGNYRDGTARILVTNKVSGVADVLCWSMKPDPAREGRFFFVNEPEELFPVTGKSIQSSICTTPEGNYYYKESEMQLVKYDANGDSLGVSSSDVIRRWGTSVKFVAKDGDDDILVYFKYRSKALTPIELVQERADILRVPSGDLSRIEVIGTTPSLGWDYNLNGWGDVHARRSGNNIEVFVLSSTNGFGKYTLKDVLVSTYKEELSVSTLKVRRNGDQLIVEGNTPRSMELISVPGIVHRRTAKDSSVSVSGMKGIYLLRVITAEGDLEVLKLKL